MLQIQDVLFFLQWTHPPPVHWTGVLNQELIQLWLTLYNVLSQVKEDSNGFSEAVKFLSIRQRH